MTKIEKENLGLNFLRTGFKDYIASRFLLQNDFAIQGITLASSAVEKYFKAILFSHQIKKRVHLNKFGEIKKLFEDAEISLLDELDETFIGILSKSYELRYYDNFSGEFAFGFLLNQAVGELDFTIHLIESRLNIKSSLSGSVMSPYMKAIESKDQRIYFDNYILNQISKKEFMERQSTTYALLIMENGQEIEMSGPAKVVEYKNKITEIVAINIHNKDK